MATVCLCVRRLSAIDGSGVLHIYDIVRLGKGMTTWEKGDDNLGGRGMYGRMCDVCMFRASGVAMKVPWTATPSSWVWSVRRYGIYTGREITQTSWPSWRKQECISSGELSLRYDHACTTHSACMSHV